MAEEHPFVELQRILEENAEYVLQNVSGGANRGSPAQSRTTEDQVGPAPPQPTAFSNEATEKLTLQLEQKEQELAHTARMQHMLAKRLDMQRDRQAIVEDEQRDLKRALTSRENQIHELKQNAQQMYHEAENLHEQAEEDRRIIVEETAAAQETHDRLLQREHEFYDQQQELENEKQELENQKRVLENEKQVLLKAHKHLQIVALTILGQSASDLKKPFTSTELAQYWMKLEEQVKMRMTNTQSSDNNLAEGHDRLHIQNEPLELTEDRSEVVQQDLTMSTEIIPAAHGTEFRRAHQRFATRRHLAPSEFEGIASDEDRHMVTPTQSAYGGLQRPGLSFTLELLELQCTPLGLPPCLVDVYHQLRQSFEHKCEPYKMGEWMMKGQTGTDRKSGKCIHCLTQKKSTNLGEGKDRACNKCRDDGMLCMRIERESDNYTVYIALGGNQDSSIKELAYWFDLSLS